MIFLCQESNQCFRICSDSLISYHICEVVDSVQFFCSLVQSFRNCIFQFLRHPYDTFDTAFSLHELLGRNKVFTMSHESRCLNTATCHGSQLWEGHSKRSHSGVLTVCDNNTIGEWLN